MRTLGRLLARVVIACGYLLLTGCLVLAAGAALHACHDGGCRVAAYEIARVTLGNLAQALRTYAAHGGGLPPDLATLRRPPHGGVYPFIDRVDPDPWGNDYVYERIAPDHGRLTSWGQDGLPGTADDLTFDVDLRGRQGKRRAGGAGR